MKPRKGSVDHSFSIELDGYETAASTTDIEDDDDDNVAGNILDLINIHANEYSESFLPDVQLRDTEDPFKNTELVLKFSYKIAPDALKWFIKRVTAKKSQGGAELLLKREPYYGQHEEGLVVHVTAAGWRLLEVAEKLEIKKMDYSRDVPRPFQVNELDTFLNENMQISDILTPAEKQMVVMHELKNFHVHPGESHVPGYKHIKTRTGQSIFHIFTSKKLISSYFALHQHAELNKLKDKWFNEFWDPEPFEDIRAYFGDATCLYFNFVAYYSYWLTIPAVIGTIMWFLPNEMFHHFAFCFSIINMLFASIFLIMWQRYQSRITYKWGTLNLEQWEEPRENYYGVLGLDPVTGKLQIKYPYRKVWLKTYFVSLPFVVFCCAVAISCMFLFFESEKMAKGYAAPMVLKTKGSKEQLFWKYGFPYLPTIGYGLVVFFFTKVYRYCAKFLTEWENHRTETQFERHLVFKMVVFEVVNSFVTLFYTAFVKNDSVLLQSRLFVLLAVLQTINTVEQLYVPAMFRKGQAKMREFLQHNQLGGVFGSSTSLDDYFHVQSQPYPGLEGINIEVMDRQDKRVQMSKVEETMAPYLYEDNFDDYLDLYLQFGYIFLFSSVYPVASAIALGCNILLLYASLDKRREVYQRAFARRVSSIGAWLQAFEFMSVFAVMTNCTLLATNEPLRESFSDFSDTEWMLLFVIIEHCILGMQYFLKKLCPKIPYRVQVNLAKLEYRSRMALKREQATNTRRRLTQVYHPINRDLYDKPRDTHSDSELDVFAEINAKESGINVNPTNYEQATVERVPRNVPATSAPPKNNTGSAPKEKKS